MYKQHISSMKNKVYLPELSKSHGQNLRIFSSFKKKSSIKNKFKPQIYLKTHFYRYTKAMRHDRF